MNENREPTEADVFEDGFEEQDMQDFFDNVAKRFCPECGTAYKRNPMGRPKLFCSEKCRRVWHRKHINPKNWEKVEQIICPVCCRVFLAAESRNRKYCSHTCANRARAKGRKDYLEHEENL